MNKIIAMSFALLLVLSVVAIADEIDQEVADYNNSSSGDDSVAEVEDDIQSEVEIDKDLNFTSEDKADLAKVKDTIGVKQFVLNLQLKHRVHVAIVHGQAIVDYLAEKGNSTTELAGILSKLNATFVSINPREMTNAQFNKTVGDVKALVLEFREKAQAMVPAGERKSVMNQIKKYEEKEKKKLDEILKKEIKFRERQNRLEISKAMEKAAKEAKELRKANQKLIESAKGLKELAKLRDRISGNMTKEYWEGLKEDWKETMKNLSIELKNDKVKNERAQLAIASARIRKAIRDATIAGENTTELEQKLSDINNEIKNFVPGKIKSEDARAKASVIESRLKNIEKDKKLIEKAKEQIKKRVENRKEARDNKSDEPDDNSAEDEGSDDIPEDEIDNNSTGGEQE